MRDSEDGRALVGRLAEALELRQPTVSHHMKALHRDGVVAREPEGRRVWYSIATEHADRVDALLGDAPRPTLEPDLDRIADDLAIRSDIASGSGSTYFQARAALNTYVAQHPNEAASLQIVPLHEVGS